MAAIDEHLKYLKDSERFPKINKREIVTPNSQLSGVEYNRIIDALDMLYQTVYGNELDVPKLSQDEYNYMAFEGTVRNRFYSIYDGDDKLLKIYLGRTIIWEARPDSNVSSVLPVEFPFIFC